MHKDELDHLVNPAAVEKLTLPDSPTVGEIEFARLRGRRVT
jgi:hypothetical protein